MNRFRYIADHDGAVVVFGFIATRREMPGQPHTLEFRREESTRAKRSRRRLSLVRFLPVERIRLNAKTSQAGWEKLNSHALPKWSRYQLQKERLGRMWSDSSPSRESRAATGYIVDGRGFRVLLCVGDLVGCRVKNETDDWNCTSMFRAESG